MYIASIHQLKVVYFVWLCVCGDSTTAGRSVHCAVPGQFRLQLGRFLCHVRDAFLLSFSLIGQFLFLLNIAVLLLVHQLLWKPNQNASHIRSSKVVMMNNPVAMVTPNLPVAMVSLNLPVTMVTLNHPVAMTTLNHPVAMVPLNHPVPLNHLVPLNHPIPLNHAVAMVPLNHPVTIVTWARFLQRFRSSSRRRFSACSEPSRSACWERESWRGAMSLCSLHTWRQRRHCSCGCYANSNLSSDLL